MASGHSCGVGLLFLPRFYGPNEFNSYFIEPIVGIVTILFLTGVLKLTTPRPGGQDASNGRRFDARFTVRFYAATIAILTLAAAVFAPFEPVNVLVVPVFAFLTIAASAAVTFSLVIHLRRLNQWFSWDRQVRRFDRARRAFVGVTIVFAVNLLVIAYQMGDSIVDLVTAASSVAGFAALFYLAIVPIDCRRQSRKAISE